MRSSRFLHWNFRLGESNWVYRVVDLDRRKNFVKVSSKSVYSVMIYLVFPGTNIMVPRYSFPLWMLHRLCTILGPDVTPKNIFDRWKIVGPSSFSKVPRKSHRHRWRKEKHKFHTGLVILQVSVCLLFTLKHADPSATLVSEMQYFRRYNPSNWLFVVTLCRG